MIVKLYLDLIDECYLLMINPIYMWRLSLQKLIVCFFKRLKNLKSFFPVFIYWAPNCTQINKSKPWRSCRDVWFTVLLIKCHISNYSWGALIKTSIHIQSTRQITLHQVPWSPLNCFFRDGSHPNTQSKDLTGIISD